jgi:hypothetical protein
MTTHTLSRARFAPGWRCSQEATIIVAVGASWRLMNPYSAYEYLSFVIPGGVLLFASFYGYNGWHWKEPGGTALVGIVAACFVVGHANAAVAQYCQPLLWGHWPSNRASSDWGMFGRRGAFHRDGDRERVEADLAAAHPGLSFQQAFSTALAGIRDTDDHVRVLNSQIGLYRNLTAATFLSLVVVVYYDLSSHRHLPMLPWVPILVAATVLFGNRYRHFWRRFGAHVVYAVRNSGEPAPMTDRKTGEPEPAAKDGVIGEHDGETVGQDDG